MCVLCMEKVNWQKSAIQKFTCWRWNESSAARDGVPLDPVAALKGFSVRRRNQRHRHRVSPSSERSEQTISGICLPPWYNIHRNINIDWRTQNTVLLIWETSSDDMYGIVGQHDMHTVFDFLKGYRSGWHGFHETYCCYYIQITIQTCNTRIVTIDKEKGALKLKNMVPFPLCFLVSTSGLRRKETDFFLLIPLPAIGQTLPKTVFLSH
jgi:hypothetical protein